MIKIIPPFVTLSIIRPLFHALLFSLLKRCDCIWVTESIKLETVIDPCFGQMACTIIRMFNLMLQKES